MSALCAQGWERVRTVLLRNIASRFKSPPTPAFPFATQSCQCSHSRALSLRLEVGASVCIFHRGRCVVDVAGGSFSSDAREREYDGSTLQACSRIHQDAKFQPFSTDSEPSPGCVQQHQGHHCNMRWHVRRPRTFAGATPPSRNVQLRYIVNHRAVS